MPCALNELPSFALSLRDLAVCRAAVKPNSGLSSRSAAHSSSTDPLRFFNILILWHLDGVRSRGRFFRLPSSNDLRAMIPGLEYT